MHAHGDAQYGAERDYIRTDVSVRNRTVICAPVVHNVVRVCKRSSARRTRSEPRARPRIVGAFPNRIGDVVRQFYRPAFDELQHGADSFDDIDSGHRHRHFGFCDKAGGKSAAAEIPLIRRTPFGRFETRVDVRFGHFPKRLHNRVSVFIFDFAARIDRTRAAVYQVDKTAGIFCLSFERIARFVFDAFACPARAHVRKHLRAVREQF